MKKIADLKNYPITTITFKLQVFSMPLALGACPHNAGTYPPTRSVVISISNILIFILFYTSFAKEYVHSLVCHSTFHNWSEYI